MNAVENKVIMVPNMAYNVFKSKSYMYGAETSRQRVETQPQPQPTSTQVEVPPRIKRVSFDAILHYPCNAYIFTWPYYIN